MTSSSPTNELNVVSRGRFDFCVGVAIPIDNKHPYLECWSSAPQYVQIFFRPHNTRHFPSASVFSAYCFLLCFRSYLNNLVLFKNNCLIDTPSCRAFVIFSFVNLRKACFTNMFNFSNRMYSLFRNCSLNQ